MPRVSVTDRILLEEWFDFVFPPNGSGGVLSMIFYTFLDDSSDRLQERVMISASFSGDKDQWAHLRTKWNARLKLDGLKYFKSSEYYGLNGEFEKFRSDDYPPPAGRQAALVIRNDLEKIVEKSGIRGLAIVIPIPVFKEVCELPEAAIFAQSRPYDWVLQSIFLETVKQLRKLPGKHAIMFGHDDGTDFPRLFEVYKGFKIKNPKTAKYMAGFTAFDDKKHPPIQVADMLADVINKHAANVLKDPSLQIERLASSIFQVAIWKKDYMLEVIKAQTNLGVIESTHDANAKIKSAQGNEKENAPHNAERIP